MGVYFVTFYKKLGYRQTVARIGRYLREFIINLDNCHDYFKLTFTNMRAPSFFIEHEHAGGEVKFAPQPVSKKKKHIACVT